MPTHDAPTPAPPAYLLADGPDTLIRVKAVPGAKSDAIVGALGDRLKVRVAAPPEDGKANRAIIELLAAALGLKPASLTLERGAAHPEKTIRARACPISHAAQALSGR